MKLSNYILKAMQKSYVRQNVGIGLISTFLFVELVGLMMKMNINLSFVCTSEEIEIIKFTHIYIYLFVVSTRLQLNLVYK